MNKERLLNTFLDLVKIYSPSRNEINVMKYITEKLEKLGVKYILHDHSAEYGGNTPVIIAKLERNCDDTNLNAISLSAHMDVVEPSKDLDVYVEDGLVKTRTETTLGGDDKGGVAIILETFESLVENKLPHNDVFAVITPSEEVGLLGAKSIKWEEIPDEFSRDSLLHPHYNEIAMWKNDLDQLKDEISGINEQIRQLEKAKEKIGCFY